MYIFNLLKSALLQYNMYNKLQILNFPKYFLSIFVANIVRGTNFKLFKFLPFFQVVELPP